MFHPKVLNKHQQEIVKQLKLPKEGYYYLAGGTALALQIGHRTSIDFDFYTQKHFDSAQLATSLKKILPSLKVHFQEEDTLRLEIGKVELSFFYYRYPLIDPLKDFQGLTLASTKDIGAMKVAAIVQRGTKRDFIDIFYLLKEYKLNELINFAIKKYPGQQKIIMLKALIYFRDAEEEKYKRPVRVFDPNFSWEKAKKKIFEEVKKYQLAMIKK